MIELRACSRRSRLALGFRGALLGQLEALAMLRHVGAQFGLEGLEDRHVLVELGHQAIDGVVDAVEQRLLLRRFAMVALAGFGDGVQQAPRRMFLEHEHAAVLHRDLDVRHQHAADLAADVGVELRTVEQHVEQQRDQVHRVFVESIQLQVVALHPELARALHHLPADLHGERVFPVAMGELQLRRQVALQQRQDRHQFIRTQGDRWAGATLPGHRSHRPAPALQQAQHAGEHGLVGGFAALRALRRRHPAGYDRTRRWRLPPRRAARLQASPRPCWWHATGAARLRQPTAYCCARTRAPAHLPVRARRI
ncbi:hypothetical protein [Thermomonas sp.]|uniref:hypothetical protein n=1 Tax=Thermomonas sp. TaxID=1971895 RepID=UPI0025CDF603|nr:hypothetical protein [Thermomonas sp.]